MKEVTFTFANEEDYAVFIKEAVEAIKPEVGTVVVEETRILVNITNLNAK